MSWLEQATDNLTALSVGNTLAEARREWRMTFGFNDRKKADGVCGLCGKEKIRYEHEIENTRNGNRLWVGSHCITKFIPIVVRGREITDEAEKDAFFSRIERNVRKKARREAAFEVLDSLAEVNTAFEGGTWRRDWELGYSVKQMQMLVISCRENGIPYNVANFKINTRRGRVVEQARKLQDWQYRQLRAAFPVSRRAELDRLFGLS